MKKINENDLRYYDESELFISEENENLINPFVNQKRAYESMKTGFEIKNRDYNIFVTGITGTGRRTFVNRIVKKQAASETTAEDWIYVFNFENEWNPIAIPLEKGLGKSFKKDIDNLTGKIEKTLETIFEDDEFIKKADEIKEKYSQKRKEVWKDTCDKSLNLDFIIQISPTGIISIPSTEGKPIKQEEYDSLSDEEKNKIEDNRMKVKILVDGYLHRNVQLEKEMSKEIEDLYQYSADFAINPFFNDISIKYQNYDKLIEFLKDMKNDILENLNAIIDNPEIRYGLFNRYRVNLFIDNSKLSGAPVKYVINPNYTNLFGKIEFFSKNGNLYTDFTLIKSGAVHQANGGYLILDALDIIKSPYIWDTLKKIIYTESITVENIETRAGYSSLATINPERIPLNIKVIMIGEPHIYDILYDMDPDFEKLFRIKAEFDYEMDNNSKNRTVMKRFIRGVAERKKLLNIENDALVEIIKYSIRHSDSRNKISTNYSKISDLIIESDRYAKSRKEKIITLDAVKEARDNKEWRISLEKEKIHKMIQEDKIDINVKGSVVGQINALSVIDMGEYAFGIPSKLTVNTSINTPGIFDIQREVGMSGKIFKKSVFILESFLESVYSVEIPLSLKTSISFEQTYGHIDGDSATVAETVAILSEIGKIPLKQGIAITGSMNQKGLIQPVGGIKEKIEGFFDICKIRGLTGEQGVIIPASNSDSLVLKEELIKAIKENKFNIWCVENIDEAVSIITGKNCKMLGSEKERFGKENLEFYVLENLRKAHEIALEEEVSEEKKPHATLE